MPEPFRFSLGPPPLSPVSRLLAGLVGILALVGAFFFGLVVLALVIGLGVLAWLALTVRIWWLGRQAPPAGQAGGAAAGSRSSSVIEGDYEVVSRRGEDNEGD